MDPIFNSIQSLFDNVSFELTKGGIRYLHRKIVDYRLRKSSTSAFTNMKSHWVTKSNFHEQDVIEYIRIDKQLGPRFSGVGFSYDPKDRTRILKYLIDAEFEDKYAFFYHFQALDKNVTDYGVGIMKLTPDGFGASGKVMIDGLWAHTNSESQIKFLRLPS